MMSSIWGFAVKSGTLNSLLLILSFILSTTQSKPVINPTLQSIDWSRVAAVTVLGSFTSISFSASAHPLPSPPHLLPTGSNTHLSIIDADNQIVYPVTISYDSIPHACAVANQIFALVLLNSAADIYVLDIYTGTAQKVWTQVNSFECDSNGAVDEGALWIATESGLTRWNPESKNVAKFNEIGAVYSLAINSGSVFASGTWNAPPPPIFETAFTLRGVGSNDQLNSCDHVLPAFPTGFSVSMYKPTKITAIRIAHSGDRADINIEISAASQVAMYYYDSSLAMHSCVTCTVTDGSNILYIQTPVVTDAMQINVVVGSLQQKRVQVYTDEMEVHVNSALNACNTAPITTVGNALANPASDTSSILIPILGNGAIQVAPNLPPGSYFITFSFDNLSALDETLAFDFGSATKMTISTSMLNTRIGPFAVVDSTTVLRLNVDSDAIPVILTSILFTPAIDTSRKAVVRALTENPTGSKLLRVDGGHIPPDAQVACVQNMRHGAVYVAGEFQTSLVSNIARLELTLPMASLAGFGLDRRVTVMSAFADLLVIGGDFTARVAIDGIAGRYAAASHVALFDTKAEKWIDIGGLDSPPSQISIDRIHHTARFSGQFTKTFDLPLDAVASGPGAEREALGVAVWSFAENRWIETIENVQGSIISSLYVEVGAGADKLVLIINAGADAAAAAAVKINSPAGFANLNTSGFQKLFDSEKHNLGISNVTSVAWNPVDELLFVAFKYAEQDKVADQEERYGVGNYASSTQKWTLLPAVFKSPVLDLAYLSDQGLLLICGNFQSLSSTAGGPGRSAKGMAVWSHWAQKWGEMPVELSNTHLNLTDSLQENLHEPVGVESIRRISPNRVLVHGRFNFSNPPSNENKQLKTTQCTDLCYFDTVTGTWDSGPQVASGRIDAVAVYKRMLDNEVYYLARIGDDGITIEPISEITKPVTKIAVDSDGKLYGFMPYNMSDLHNSTYGSLISVDGATFAVSIVLDNVMITDMTWVDITSDKDVKVPSLLLAGRFPVLDPASADDGKYALVVYSPRSSLKLMAHTYGLVSRLVSATSADSAALGLHASVGSDMLPWMLPLVASALLVFLGCFAWVLLMRGSVDKIKAKRGTCGNLGSRDTGAGIDGLDTSTDVTTDEAFDFDIESLETVKKSYSQTTTESDLNLSTAKENCKPISTRPRLAIKTGFAALDKGGCLSPTQQRLLTSESLTSLSDAERPPWLSRASSDASRVLDLEMGCEVTSMSTQNSVYSHIKS